MAFSSNFRRRHELFCLFSFTFLFISGTKKSSSSNMALAATGTNEIRGENDTPGIETAPAFQVKLTEIPRKRRTKRRKLTTRNAGENGNAREMLKWDAARAAGLQAHRKKRKGPGRKARTPDGLRVFFDRDYFADKNPPSGSAFRHFVHNKYCGYCNLRLQSYQQYESHFKDEHDPELPYLCPICDVQFKNRFNLKVHLIRTHGKDEDSDKDDDDDADADADFTAACKGTKRCRICGAGLRSYKYLEEHGLKAHPKLKTISCPHCPETFYKKADVVAHVAEHVTCRYCRNRFRDDVERRSHEQKCGIRYRMIYHGENNKADLKDAEDKPYLPTFCDVCSVTFGTNREYLGHCRAQHPKKKTMFCEDCGKGYTSKSHLSFHANKYHPNVNNVGPKKFVKKLAFPCEYCDARVFGVKNYERHCRIQHAGKASFHCKVCRKGFTMKCAMIRHVTDLHGNGNLMCDRCGMCYSRKDVYKQHRSLCSKTADGKYGAKCDDEQYDACAVCGKRFLKERNPEALANHMHRRHTMKFNIEALLKTAQTVKGGFVAAKMKTDDVKSEIREDAY